MITQTALVDRPARESGAPSLLLPVVPVLPRRPTLVPRRRHRHVVAEDLFRHLLIADRKRAARSDRPSVVLIVAATDRRRIAGPPVWRETIEALTRCTRQTDVVGWFDDEAVIGVILHEVRAQDPAYPREVEARVRRELARHLDPEVVAQFWIGLEFHPPRPAPPDSLAVAAGEDAYEPPHARATRKPAYDAIKRVLDVAISAALLLILSPLFLLIAVLIKIESRGPVLFKQQRIGSMGKPFHMLKFRTMHVNADHALHHEFVSRFITAGTNGEPPGTSGFFKITNDPRVTSIGRVLRKTSLDELPQLWNVLRGEMSLVGPRPPLPYEVEQYKPWHTRRLIEAKPGITGLWQVGGRSRTTFDDMVRLDLRYARTCSLWTDIKILAATPGAVISGKGAC